MTWTITSRSSCSPPPSLRAFDCQFRPSYVAFTITGMAVSTLVTFRARLVDLHVVVARDDAAGSAARPALALTLALGAFDRPLAWRQ
jgi:hypothetical protein